MPNHTTKNYKTDGGDKWVIGGILEALPNATIKGIGGGGNTGIGFYTPELVYDIQGHEPEIEQPTRDLSWYHSPVPYFYINTETFSIIFLNMFPTFNIESKGSEGYRPYMTLPVEQLPQSAVHPPVGEGYVQNIGYANIISSYGENPTISKRQLCSTHIYNSHVQFTDVIGEPTSWFELENNSRNSIWLSTFYIGKPITQS